MADIELVIKIPSEVYENIISATADDNDISILLLGIHEATPLPKGHGRLIDADAFERRCMFDSNIEDMQDVIYALRDYKPIIEADKESNDTHDKTCVNCFHNYGVRHNVEFNPEDIVCEYWESDGLTKDDFCSRWKDKESEE